MDARSRSDALRSCLPRSLVVRSLLFGGLLAWLVTSAWQAFSSEGASAEAPHRIPVAILDVAAVFKSFNQFNAQMAALKEEIEAFDKELKAKQAAVASASSAGPASGTAADENKEAHKKAAAMLAEAAAVVKRQEFLQREARVYAEMYAAIETTIAQVAKSRDVGIVFRYSRDPLNAADRASVLQYVNRPVLYSAVPDLTDEVSKLLNEAKL